MTLLRGPGGAIEHGPPETRVGEPVTLRLQRSQSGWPCKLTFWWEQADGWYTVEPGDGTRYVCHPDLDPPKHLYTRYSSCITSGTWTAVARRLYRDGSTGPVEAECTVVVGAGKHKEEPMPRPAIAAERYVNPSSQTGIRLLHPWQQATAVTFRSEAFTGGTERAYPAEFVHDDVEGRVARADIPIDDVQPGEYDVVCVGVLDDGEITVRRRLLVEPVHDGVVFVTHDRPVKPGPPAVQFKIDGLSRNAHTGDAKSPMWHGGGEWQALVYDRFAGSAHQGFSIVDGLEAGRTYEVEVAQVFHGGHREVVKGTVTLPPPEPKPVDGLFTAQHDIVLTKLGDGDSVVHTVPFGSRRLTNTGYSWTAQLKTVDPRTGKPVQPTQEEAAELAKLQPFHFVRHLDRLELYTANPHKLRGNSRFRLIWLVTVFPVADDDAGYADSEAGDA